MARGSARAGLTAGWSLISPPRTAQQVHPKQEVFVLCLCLNEELNEQIMNCSAFMVLDTGLVFCVDPDPVSSISGSGSLDPNSDQNYSYNLSLEKS